LQFGKKTLAKVVAQANKSCDEAVLNLFRVAYYIGKNTIPFNKYMPLCELLLTAKANITERFYHDEKTCVDTIFCTSKIIKTKVLDRIRNAK
jgi:hypothetical protein